MNGDEIRLAEQVLLADVVDARLLAFLRREVLAPGDDLHAERLGDLGGAGAELAEAEDAEGQVRRDPCRSWSAKARRPSCARSRSRCGGSARASGRWRCRRSDCRPPGVPHTTMPRSFAAATSIEALRMPVVIRSFRSGSFSITARGKAVRSRMAQTMSKPCSALTTLSGPPRCCVEHLDVERRPQPSTNRPP